jgi:hypothetical protein
MTRCCYIIAATALALNACGGAADEGLSPPPLDLDYTTDFVPGNPNFKRNPALDVDLESVSDEFRSHNMGENCLKCHQEHGPGRGRFTLAGTLYNTQVKPFPNGMLKLFARADVTDGGATVLSEEVLSLPIDGRGNFFTTAPLPGGYPTQKLYPRFFGPNGESLIGPDEVNFAQMNGGITMGSCNYCHGTPMRVRGRLP